MTADLFFWSLAIAKVFLPKIVHILKGRFEKAFLQWFVAANPTAFKETSAVAKYNK